MDLDLIMAEYGLWFAFVGTAISGDTVALTAGVLEQRGVFAFWHAVTVVALGGWVSDLGLFLIAKLFRAHPAVIRAMDHPQAQRFVARFLGRPIILAALFRFVPGSRTFVPMALGTAGTISFRVYALVTGITSFVWSWLLIELGHEIGDLIYSIWGRVREVENILIWPALILAVVLVSVIWRLLHVRKRNSAR